LKRDESARIGVDIGGTFTDVALQAGEVLHTAKVLTTVEAPERGVLNAVRAVMDHASLAPTDVSTMIHGTTLATNALIERKGAHTALECKQQHQGTTLFLAIN